MKTMLAASAVTASLPWSIQRALATPAHSASGSIEDVEHIVIFMQENRSVDHYFGHLSGVRGYNDRFHLIVWPGCDCSGNNRKLSSKWRLVRAFSQSGEPVAPDPYRRSCLWAKGSSVVSEWRATRGTGFLASIQPPVV